MASSTHFNPALFTDAGLETPITLAWSKLPINVDFLAFVDWMRYEGSWIPCKITFVDTFTYDRFTLTHPVDTLKHFSFHDMKRNEQLDTSPIHLLQRTCGKVFQGNIAGEHVQCLFELALEGKPDVCCIATSNRADFQFLDKHLSHHDVVEFEPNFDREELIQRYRFKRDWPDA